jgi:heme-degrading monooxygenase HmoA
MNSRREGQVAVIFAATRTGEDEQAYEAAAREMAALVACQPGYCGHLSTRNTDGFGITISYWADDAAAQAWRDHPDHKAIRDAGRDRWYSAYTLDVATIARSYDWSKNDRSSRE